MPALRWGILSTAHIAQAALVPAIHAAGNGEVVAVASRSTDSARAFAERNGIPRHHGSYDRLLQDAEIDAIYIPLPNSMHRDWTLRAAEAGKHILCEKPLALNEAECREMDEAARVHGVVLMEAFMYRFHPRTERLIELVRAGAIGEVRMVRSAFSFRLTRPGNIRLDPELGGGALMDVGCYCVNIARTLLGEPVEVQAFSRLANTGVDEQLAGTMRFANGEFAQFDCALTLERREFVEVAGTEGRLLVETAFLPGTAPVSILEQRGRADPVRHEIGGEDEYRLMVEHFGDCVRSGNAVRYSAAEAALNMRTIEALYRSAALQGGPQNL